MTTPHSTALLIHTVIACQAWSGRQLSGSSPPSDVKWSIMHARQSGTGKRTMGLPPGTSEASDEGVDVADRSPSRIGPSAQRQLYEESDDGSPQHDKDVFHLISHPVQSASSSQIRNSVGHDDQVLIAHEAHLIQSREALRLPDRHVVWKGVTSDGRIASIGTDRCASLCRVDGLVRVSTTREL